MAVLETSWWWRMSRRWWWWLWLTLLLYDPSRGGSALPHRPPTTPTTPTHCRGCPYFLATPSQVTTAVGQPVNLTCGVRMLGDRQVSWIRRKDLHVLTTDSFTYTSDPRFSALHQPSSPYWILHVAHPTLADAGVYECQVSAQPKIFRPFTLEVVEPRAVIVGGQEVFMRAGSDLNITCLIKGATPNTTPVTWLRAPVGSSRANGKSGKNVEEVNSGGRGGVQLVTDRRAGTSWLLVTRATWRDGGTYTCAPARARPASVVVHVLDGETPAAMQPPLDTSHTPEASSSSSSSSSTSSSSTSSSTSSSSPSSSLSSWWWPRLVLVLVLQSSVKLWAVPFAPHDPIL